MRILLVEDDLRIATLVQKGLEAEHLAVETANSGPEALRLCRDTPPDLMILDVMLPGMGGLEVCRTLREEGIGVPVLMLTARDALEDKLAGFRCGADDYLTKPFAFAELLARVRALLRRGSAAPAADRLQVDDLVLDRNTLEVSRAGRPIELTHKEFVLLEFLMRHVNQALSRAVILEHVWDYNFDSFTNVVDVTIRRLRQKIDDPFPHKLIQTIRGIGYRIRA